MNTYRIQVAKRGVITLPVKVREKTGIQDGEVLTLIDLNGILVLIPKDLQIDYVADRLAAKWREKGESLESMLNTLREVREEYRTNE